MFRQATRMQSKLRMTLDGPAGSGKTYTALRFAHVLAQGGKIAVIDTERGSASKYVGEAPDGIPWQFDTAQLVTFGPDRYTEAILAAARAGYSVLVIDSLSHAWEGVGGALEMKDRIAGNGNQFAAWREVTPLHNRMVDAILQAPMHVITTMRSRTEYVMETNEQGRIVGVRRVGMSPVQRSGMEYEFDIVCDMDWSHVLTVGKSRCSAVADMRVEKPGPEFIHLVMDWLNGGNPVPPKQTPQVMTLEDLLDRFGIDDVLAANGGMPPSTQEEIDAVFEKLA